MFVERRQGWASITTVKAAAGEPDPLEVREGDLESQRGWMPPVCESLGSHCPEATQGPWVLLGQPPDTWASGGEGVRPQAPSPRGFRSAC